MSLADARAVADAVLYEGYLLYPYRATSAKNQLRWQFGVLGPPGAAEDGIGDDPRLATQCLLHAPPGEPEPDITVHLRLPAAAAPQRRRLGRGGRARSESAGTPAGRPDHRR